MKKSTLFISSLVLSTVLAFGQNSRKAQIVSKVDNTIERYAKMPKTPDGFIRCITPEQKEPEAQFENWLSQKIKEIQLNPILLKASRNIPVVVHVLHNGDAVGANENISDAQINSQITALNLDYSATNADFANVPSTFNSAKGNMDIQFCLAQTDPSGQPTTGIHRVNIGVASVSDTDIETNYGLNNMWDPTKYLNIFVANFTGGQLLGKAVFPLSSGLPGLGGSFTGYDGVMIWYRSFGTTGSLQAPYNKGRTATHEIGHWLGLRHIGGDASGGCGTDYCADTPTQKGGLSSNFTGNDFGQNYGCPTHPLVRSGECSGTTAEMFMNYMDYTDDACMYMFTNNQKSRMDAVLANSPRRASLLTSNVCSAAAITANFTASATVINEGQTVTFTDASTSPATLNSWSWTFTGGLPASHSGQTPPAITYSTAGTYAVSLTVGDNAAGSDTETKTAYITVNAAGTVTCDSTAAGWDWNTEPFYTGAYWDADLNPDTTSNDGYIMGNNLYDDNGWATKVTFSGTGKEITDLIYLFDQSTGTGAGRLRVWNANGAAGAPNTVLFSYPITTGQFSANLQQLILVPVSPAVAVTGNFYIGNDHNVTPLDGDTLCMAIAPPTSGNQLWAKETGGWKDLSAYGVSYKATAGVVICDIETGVLSHNIQTTEVSVRPNPTTGIITVLAPVEVNSFKVAVFNMLGEEVVSESVNSNATKLNLNNQPNGVYFVKVTANGVVTTQKVLLSK